MARSVWPVFEPPPAATADQESGEAVAAVGAKHAPTALGTVGYSRNGMLFEFVGVRALKQEDFGVAGRSPAKHSRLFGRVAVDCAEGVGFEVSLGAVSASDRRAAAVTRVAWTLGF